MIIRGVKYTGSLSVEPLVQEQKSSVKESDIIKIVTEALQDNAINVMIQPIVSLPDRKTRFFECFSSITLRDGTILGAGQFIKLAEESNLVSVIDNTILFHTMKIIRLSKRRDVPVQFFCNISAQTLLDDIFLKSLERFLKDKKELAKSLVFEVTLKDFESNLAKLKKPLRKLRGMGASLSVDNITDFAINLLELDDLSFNFLKINAQALFDSNGAKRPQEDVNKFLDSCRSNNVTPIFSNVENNEAVEILSQYDVRYAQGYLFGKPTLLQKSKTTQSKTIEITATGIPCTAKTLEEAHTYLSARDFPVYIPENLIQNNSLYVANNQQRFLNLKEALYSEATEILWNLRGGFGTSPLLSELHTLEPPKKKKHMIGFCCLSELHLFLYQKWGWQTIYGANLFSLIRGAWGAETERVMEKIANSQYVDIETEISSLNFASHIKQPMSADMVGGSVDYLQRSIGTPWQIEGEGKFLFLDAANQSIAQLLDNLYHFKHAGVFKGVKALLFGGFPHTHPEEDRDALLKRSLEEFSGVLKFPVFYNFPVGRLVNNKPVQIGGRAEIKPTGSKIIYKQIIHLS